MWGELWRVLGEAVGRDVAEFRDVAGLLRVALRLLLAAALGGLLGLERTVHRRPAGLRTYMLVSLGSAAFALVSVELGMHTADLSRVIQGLVAGIGFLGAGVIVKSEQRNRTRGLTTAAGVWLTASVGLAVGLGRPATALLTTLLALLILAPLRRIEGRVDARRHRHASPGEPPRPS
jgi:putative Mg2+ transporter-C (MgtC) family protein